MLTIYKNTNIKLKDKTDGQFNLYSVCIDYDFKKFETIANKEWSCLLKF